MEDYMEDDATIAQLVNLRCRTRTMALFEAQCGRGCPTSGKCHREHQRHQTVKLRRWKMTGLRCGSLTLRFCASLD